MEMRSFFFLAATTVFLLSFFSFSTPAHAKGNTPSGPWAWLELDAALAEEILFDGDLSAAGQLALETHKALAAAVDDVTNARGSDWVANLHDELSDVLFASGFEVPPAPGADGLADAQP